ncbi:SHOCT domain-containing protein [Corynebacterium alimapuense]|uniref:SHOCT domain-containing protein n=1 Tax=Corynebacterium alimapuense TaxID=1576874 RepID=A0A3M8K4T6_9CORY|nr:SHOCT domain-containing protein [Corynebacterium alimapuense]RNE48237.1 hypothetical protein C5L39_10290 [Corynebacterium alimapuense]
MDFLTSFWDLLLVFFWAFIFIASLFLLIMVFSDLFRDKKLSGWWKAVWAIFLVFIPLGTALVYLIFRGRGMTERNMKDSIAAQKQAEDYIRTVAGASPAEEISRAKALLDSGAISADEFEQIKRSALAS